MLIHPCKSFLFFLTLTATKQSLAVTTRVTLAGDNRYFDILAPTKGINQSGASWGSYCYRH